MIVAAHVEQVEDALVVDAVVDARAFAARLDETDPPQCGQVLRGAAGVELELCLQRADRALAVAQQLEDPDARRVAEHPEELAFTSWTGRAAWGIGGPPPYCYVFRVP